MDAINRQNSRLRQLELNRKIRIKKERNYRAKSTPSQIVRDIDEPRVRLNYGSENKEPLIALYTVKTENGNGDQDRRAKMQKYQESAPMFEKILFCKSKSDCTVDGA